MGKVCEKEMLMLILGGEECVRKNVWAKAKGGKNVMNVNVMPKGEKKNPMCMSLNGRRMRRILSKDG